MLYHRLLGPCIFKTLICCKNSIHLNLCLYTTNDKISINELLSSCPSSNLPFRYIESGKQNLVDNRESVPLIVLSIICLYIKSVTLF